MDYMYQWFVFLWGVYALENYLNFRQWKVVRKSTYSDLNAMLKSHFTEDSFKKSKSYANDKMSYGFVHEFYENIRTTVFTVLFVSPWFWGKAKEICAQYGFENEYYETCVVIFLTTIFESVIGLPWGYYSNFVLEQKHGFNNMTVKFWLTDKLKKLFTIGIPLNSAIMCMIVWVVKFFGDNFYLYAWALVSVLMFVMMYIYPEFIAPLFDKYSPLKEGVLKEKIEKLAGSLDFPLKKLYVVDGSKRSSHSNAYMYGFRNNKRIVLFDTLIASECTGKNEGKGCEDDEIVAVLGHELGHWKMGHTVKMLIIQEVLTFVVFYGFGFFINNDELFANFGYAGQTEAGVYIKLTVVLTTIMAPMFEVVGLCMTLFIRSNEFEADRFAVGLGYGELLEKALAKLFNDNSNFPLCDSWYAWKNHSHPHFNERVAELRVQTKKFEAKEQ